MKRKRITHLFWNQQQKIAPYLFIAPFYLLFVVFMGYPLISSLVMSLYEMRGFQSRIFVGFGNFTDLFRDPIFWKSLRNTAYFAAGTLTLQLPIALLLAILLNSKFVKGKNFLRLAFFAPVLVAGVFVAIIFNLVYDQRAGLVNQEFVLFGKEIGWLNEENYVMPAIILTGVWQWAGFNMIYFLAGLQGIRQELYEAAAVDGATGGKRSLESGYTERHFQYPDPPQRTTRKIKNANTTSNRSSRRKMCKFGTRYRLTGNCLFGRSRRDGATVANRGCRILAPRGFRWGVSR